MRESGNDLRERVVRYRADPMLSREQAAARISAYVYGNIVVFASVVPLTGDDLHRGHASLLVLGVAASTYLAHVFADLIGAGVRSQVPVARGAVWHELRDAVPVVSSGVVPALLLLAGGLGWLPERGAVLASEGYLLVRLAGVGLLVERLRATGRPSVRTVLAGVALAFAAAVISLVKVAVGH